MDFKDRKTLFLIVFCSAVIVVSAIAFVYKLTEFSMTVVRDGLEGFGIVAISVYLVGLTGLLMWNMWAYSKGYFRNIEAPKYRMLEMEEEYDKVEHATGTGFRVDS